MALAVCFNCRGMIVVADRGTVPAVCRNCGGVDLVLYGRETREAQNSQDALAGRHACPCCGEYGLTFGSA